MRTQSYPALLYIKAAITKIFLLKIENNDLHGLVSINYIVNCDVFDNSSTQNQLSVVIAGKQSISYKSGD